MGKQKNEKSFDFKINDEITFKGNVRIIGENIESKVVPINEAKYLARKMDLDLIEFNSKINPPIMKIGNYNKLIYELKKNAKKNKQTVTQVKEIQLSVNIANHDLEIKANKAKEFLKEGHKVRAVLTMRGRELSRKEENKRSLLEFIVMLEDVAVIENNLVDNGNKTFVILKKK